MWLPGANTEGYHASKLTEKERRDSITWSCFMAFTLWPQVSGMLAPFIWSWQARSGQKPHGSHTVRAETLQQELSSRMGTRSPSSQHPTDMLASGTAGHILICVSGNEALPRCFLFLQGFQGSSLPSKSEKKRCELRHQLLRGVAHGFENPNWQHLENLCKVGAQPLPSVEGGPPSQMPHLQATLWEPSGSSSEQSCLYPRGLSLGN